MSEYTFNDVLIKPQYSEVLSRSNVDLSCKLGNHTFNLPAISANMKTITGSAMASIMNDYGGLGILHRFCAIEDNVKMYEEAVGLCKSDKKQIGVSIGVQEEDKRRFEELYQVGARIFCVDVAHGHHVLVKNMLQWINDQIFLWDRNSRGKITLIAGNIATPEAYYDLTEWGADAIKCGIGNGKKCTTRYAAGVGYPQLSALEEIYNQSKSQLKYPSIIADGGLNYVGDIAKALKYADMVMIGNMISGTTETPGKVFKGPDGTYYKVYGGSASGENKGENKFVEGVTSTIPFKGKVKYILKEIKEGLQSSCSYVGAHNLIKFKAKCEFVRISDGASRESKF
jgi:IMP dehydrogenase